MKKTYEEGKEDGYSDGFYDGRASGFFWALVVVLVASLSITAFVEGMTLIDSQKSVTIDSKIVGIDYETEKSYYTVHFEDGSVYNINKDISTDREDNIIDFDDSENVIVELRYTSGFLSRNTDNCWGIVSLIKY